MKIRTIYLLVYLFFSQLALSQTDVSIYPTPQKSSLKGHSKLEGIILDKTTGEPIPYVSIGLISKSIGTVSDANGCFYFKMSDRVKMTDTLTFLHVSFESMVFPISKMSINERTNIYLQERVIVVNDVIVIGKQRKRKDKKLGKGSTTNNLVISYYNEEREDKYVWVDNMLGHEAGMLFKPKHDCMLNNVNFNIVRNENSHVKLRLTFYKYDKKKKQPIDFLNYNDIIIDVKDKYTGVMAFDLKPYSIYIKDGESFVATLTMVDIRQDVGGKNFELSMSVGAFSPLFMRSNLKPAWDKIKVVGLGLYFNTTAYVD